MSGRFTGVVAAIAGLLAVLLTGTGTLPTLAGAGGLLLLVGGLLAERGELLTLGATGLFAATLLAGVDGASAPTLVAASGAIVVAWTVGRTSVELRSALPGADARTVEYTHVAGTTVLVGGAGAVALLPRSLTVTPSPLGLALVLFGATCLTAALFVD